MNNSIDGSTVTYASDIVVDPNFFVPPGLVDIRTFTEDDLNTTLEEQETQDEEEDSYLIPETEELPVPENITIVSQSVRSLVNGGQVIDVVLEIEDIPGINDFEVRVTKA